MGLMSIRGESLDAIQSQIWYPDMVRSRSEHSRVFSQPGFKLLYEQMLSHTDSIVEVFELNKAIKGVGGEIAASRPGIAARMQDDIYEIHLPVKEHWFDTSSMVVKEVFLPSDETDPYKHGPFAGRIATAMAIQAHLLIPEHA